MSRRDTKDAVRWFVNKISGKRDMRGVTFHATPKIGNMYLYQYDPKWKEVLPFWDRQPLTIPIKYYNDGFLGLNLHYLPISGREKLLKALAKYTEGEGEKRQFAISYSILQSAIRHRLFMPCVKRYLTSHIRSQFEWIPPEEWHKAVKMPTQRFSGASSANVWRRSVRR